MTRPRERGATPLLAAFLLSIAAPLTADPVQAAFAAITLSFPNAGAHAKTICRVDATNAAGLSVQAVQDGLKLSSGDGRGVTLKLFDAAVTHVSSPHGVIWTLRDKLGRNVVITDKAPNVFIAINRTDRPLNIAEQTKSPRKSFSALPHSLTILNNVEYPVTMSADGRDAHSSRFNIPRSPLPLRVIYSDGAQEFQMKTGRTGTETDLGKTTKNSR